MPASAATAALSPEIPSTSDEPEVAPLRRTARDIIATNLTSPDVDGPVVREGIARLRRMLTGDDPAGVLAEIKRALLGTHAAGRALCRCLAAGLPGPVVSSAQGVLARSIAEDTPRVTLLAACGAAASWGPAGGAFLRRLRQRVRRDPHWTVAAAAARALGQIAPDDRMVQRLLRDVLRQGTARPSVSVRLAALEALSQASVWSPRTAAAVVAALDDGNRRVRASAVRHLRARLADPIVETAMRAAYRVTPAGHGRRALLREAGLGRRKGRPVCRRSMASTRRTPRKQRNLGRGR